MKNNLTHSEAIKRADSINPGIKYDLYLFLKKGKKYKGGIKINFTIKKKSNIFLDYSGRKITYLKINQKNFSQEEISKIWKNGKIYIKEKNLLKNENEILIKFESYYDLDKVGLFTYTDIDDYQYIYSQSVPYFINRVFPVFDQPDLKSCLKFFIVAPKDWEVVTNEKLVKCYNWLEFDDDYDNKDNVFFFLNVDFLAGTDFYVFERTKMISSYLFCLAAGNYRYLKFQNEDIPINIYCRSNIFSLLITDSSEILGTIKNCLKFFTEFFKIPYPFSKLDLILVPLSKYGAMENPGIITFADSYGLFNEKTQNNISRRRRTLAHEISHQWFGNLVTMKWWNDIWLNEAFADFMGYIAFNYLQINFVNDIIKNFDGWLSFGDRKKWGYVEDMCNKTTHPIACEIYNSDEANTIFDGISYSKGGAAISQLYFLVGEELFRDCLNVYFERFKWGNTTLDDFIMVFDEKLKKYDFIKWGDSWLKKTGLNTLKVKREKNELICKQGFFCDLFPFLRKHSMRFSFFNKNSEVVKEIDVVIEDKVFSEIGVDFEYEAVLPNSNDGSFILIIFENNDLEFFKKNLGKIKNNLHKYIIIFSLFAMIKQIKLNPREFFKILINSKILEKTFGNYQLLNYITTFIFDTFKYIPKDIKNFSNFFLIYFQFFENEIKLNEKSVLFNNLVKLAKNDFHLKILIKIILSEKQNFFISSQNKYEIFLKIKEKNFDLDLKKKYFDYIKNLIDTNSILLYKKITLKCLKFKNLEEIEKSWNNYLCKNRDVKSYEFTYLMKGLKFVIKKFKFEFYFEKKFFEDFFFLIKNESYQICKEFFIYAFPDLGNNLVYIDKLNGILEKIKDSNKDFCKIILKKIDFLTTLEKLKNYHC